MRATFTQAIEIGIAIIVSQKPTIALIATSSFSQLLDMYPLRPGESARRLVDVRQQEVHRIRKRSN
jgi:hypothetical protein